LDSAKRTATCRLHTDGHELCAECKEMTSPIGDMYIPKKSISSRPSLEVRQTHSQTRHRSYGDLLSVLSNVWLKRVYGDVVDSEHGAGAIYQRTREHAKIADWSVICLFLWQKARFLQ